MLTNGGSDLLLALVANEVRLNGRVDAEHGLQVMHILSFHSHSCKINLRADTSSRNLGQLSCHVEGEGTELLDVDTSAGSDVVAEVLAQRLPNNEHLSLGLQRLQVGAGALGGLIMTARVVVSVLKDPIRLKEKRELNGLLQKVSCQLMNMRDGNVALQLPLLLLLLSYRLVFGKIIEVARGQLLSNCVRTSITSFYLPVNDLLNVHFYFISYKRKADTCQIN